MHYTAWTRLAGAALLLIMGSGRLQSQGTDIPARTLSPGAVTSLCAELQTWFADQAAAFTRSVRTGGAEAMRRYQEGLYSDSSALVVKGSGNFIFYSRSALVDSLARMPFEMAPDRFFEYRAVATSVALITSRRALFVQRYLEIDSATAARGMARIYSGMEAGTIVRTLDGWRILERVNSTGSLGTTDSATTRVRPWQCR